MLTVEGIAGVEGTTVTQLFSVPLLIRKGKRRSFQCYDLETKASVADPPDNKSYQEMCYKFGVSCKDVERPKTIDILILVSMRQNKEHPKAVSSRGDMTLWEGDFGKMFGGVEESLMFKPHILSCHIRSRQRGCMYSTTLRAIVKAVSHVGSVRGDRELLHYFEEDSIGIQVSPKYGACVAVSAS